MRRWPRKDRFNAGFSLLELMVTIAVVGILAAIAVPNLRPFLQNNRLSSVSNDLLRSFQLARSEAIKRQANVVVCASSNPTDANPTCSYGPFRGWIVFQENTATTDWQHQSTEPLIERHGLIDSTVTVKNDNDGIESYAATGFANPSGTGTKNPTQNVLLCDIRGNQASGSNSVERALLIQTTGRARITSDKNKITALVTSFGGCP